MVNTGLYMDDFSDLSISANQWQAGNEFHMEWLVEGSGRIGIVDWE